MGTKTKPRKIWECQDVLDARNPESSVCGYRYEDPLGASSVTCPNDHYDKRGARQRKLLTVIWSKKEHGGEPPT